MPGEKFGTIPMTGVKFADFVVPNSVASEATPKNMVLRFWSAVMFLAKLPSHTSPSPFSRVAAYRNASAIYG